LTDDMDESDRATGTQLLDRAVAVLTFLGEAGQGGARASAITEAVGLKSSTAHRIITALERHNLIEREKATRRYRLSVALFALGSQAAEGTGLRKLCRPALLRIAAETGDTVFLMARSGSSAVTVDRQEGTYMIASLTNSIGGQIPLGVGPAGEAILAFLPPDEIDAVIEVNANAYTAFSGLTASKVRDALPMIRESGYAIDEGSLVEGISALAVPIRPQGRDVVAALSINMTSARLSQTRLPSLLAMLRQEVAAVEAQLSATRKRRTSPTDVDDE
jgi:DNA-binding IclR family transcriptional regulator